MTWRDWLTLLAMLVCAVGMFGGAGMVIYSFFQKLFY